MQGINRFIVWHHNLIIWETLFFYADDLNKDNGNKCTKKSTKPTPAIHPPPSCLGGSRINVLAEVHRDKQGRFSYLNIVFIMNLLALFDFLMFHNHSGLLEC